MNDNLNYISAFRTTENPKIIRLAHHAAVNQEFADSVARGLAQRPARLECRFLYDAYGSELYELITEQPEYYPTRTEAAILADCARRLREIAGPVTLLELGSGSSLKTDHLLRAWNGQARYIPVDVSESALLLASKDIRRYHPDVQIIGLNGTYEDVFPFFAEFSPLMLVFLGGTIGNLSEDEAATFFRRVVDNLNEGDYFLLGVDLVKDQGLLEAAYNDEAGVTAAFTRNLFARMNRELDSGLDLSAIEHVARWIPDKRRIEIHARFKKDQTLRIAPLGSSFEIARDEEILVEISRKFILADIKAELEAYDLCIREIFTDEKGWFALLLLEKSAHR